SAAPRAAGPRAQSRTIPSQSSAPPSWAASPSATPASPSSLTWGAVASRISPPAPAPASALPPPSPDQTPVITPVRNPYLPPRNLGFVIDLNVTPSVIRCGATLQVPS